jgi:hypothetical protein
MAGRWGGGSVSRDVSQIRPHQRRAQNHPAMAAGVDNRLWEMSDLVEVTEEWEGTQG